MAHGQPTRGGDDRGGPERAAKDGRRKGRAGAGVHDPLTLFIQGQPYSKANSRRLVRGRSIKSAEALAYREFAILQARSQIARTGRGFPVFPKGVDVSVSGWVWYSWRGPDLDLSLVFDLLEGLAYDNDRQVRWHRDVRWALDKREPRAELTFAPIAEEWPR